MALAQDLINVRPVRNDRIFHPRVDPLATLTDKDIISKYRLSRDAIEFLIDILNDQLTPKTKRSHAIPTNIQVLASLYYLANGSMQSVVGDCRDLNISQPSISRYVRFKLKCDKSDIYLSLIVGECVWLHVLLIL